MSPWPAWTSCSLAPLLLGQYVIIEGLWFTFQLVLGYSVLTIVQWFPIYVATLLIGPQLQSASHLLLHLIYPSREADPLMSPDFPFPQRWPFNGKWLHLKVHCHLPVHPPHPPNPWIPWADLPGSIPVSLWYQTFGTALS